jgi:hypothetical protein
MADDGLSAYSKRELRQVAKVLSEMGDDAADEARRLSYDLATYALSEIKQAAYQRRVSAAGIRKVVDGAKLSRTSKTGQISFGFAGQRFSGGATTKLLWGAYEFGTKRNDLPQFPQYSGRYGGGSRGWFIYPTLRRIQPELTERWTDTISKVLKKWGN